LAKPKMKKCPWCKGYHRKKSTARKCYYKHNKAASTWTKAEIGV